MQDVPEFPEDKVVYGDVIEYKYEVLDLIYEEFKTSGNNLVHKLYQDFCEKEKDWLDELFFIYCIKRSPRWKTME